MSTTMFMVYVSQHYNIVYKAKLTQMHSSS